MEISSKDCSSKDLYKLLTGIIVPRPIAFVSTKSKNGVYNIAPFSFFNAITSDPPTVMFVAGERKGQKKDTIVNIEMHPEFVINVVTEEIAQPMHDSAADFLPDVSEFDEVGLTQQPAKMIDGMAVKESPIHMECKLNQIIKVGNSYMVLGEVVHFHIEDDVYLEHYKIDIPKLKPLGRLAGNGYTNLGSLIELERHTPDKSKLVK
jgi:flavin reductase (DIM6/NTAB) family NADH-FMN oxidoreductase RutF